MLLLNGRGDSAHLGIPTKKAEQMSLPSLSHIPVDVQTDVRRDAGARAHIFKPPQP